jgi:hypothetical protein
MDKVVPIIGPLVNLLRSRKFLVGFLALALDVIIAYIPDLEGQRETIMQAATTVIAALIILGIAYEDGMAKSAG